MNSRAGVAWVSVSVSVAVAAAVSVRLGGEGISFPQVEIGGVPALAAPQSQLPTPEVETLPNGLQVAWFLKDRLPLVDLALLVKSGFRDDPMGKTGTAELVSSTLERGAGGLSPQQLARSIEMLGASRYSSADDDAFTVGMHGLSKDAPALIDLLSKIALQPEFPDAEVKREHGRLLDRWNHLGDSGETLASLAFHRILASGTDYARGNFLSIEEFKKVGKKDVVEYYRKHFTPKNSILMVVGKVDRPAFREKLLATFGKWQGEAPKRQWKPYSDPRLKAKPGDIVVVDRPGLTQAQVRIGFKAPLFTSPDHYPLVVANALLGGFFQSRLNSVIRDQLGLTYGIGSTFLYSRDLGKFLVSSATKNESVGQVIQRTVSILSDLKKGPIPEEEVQMSKDYLVGGFPLSVSTLNAVAARWLAGHIYELGSNYLNEYMPKVQAVTAAQASQAVKKHFAMDRLTIVVAGDGKEIVKHLTSDQKKRVKRVSVRDLR